MTPIGSSGDVYPFVGIGRMLRTRGHDVTIITAENFRSVAENVGLGFDAYPESAEEFDLITTHSDLWHPRRGVTLVMKTLAQGLAGLYDRLSALYEPGKTLLVGHTLSFATRVFEEKHRVPAVTLHLAPSVFRTNYQLPAHKPGSDLSRLPMWLKNMLWWLVDRNMLDPPIEESLNRWRSQCGLYPVHRIFRNWVHSPQQTIGLFPDWFGPPQPDWPSAACVTGFPLFEDTGPLEHDAQLETFFNKHPQPIIFTPGSANRHANRFFTAAVGAAQQLQRPALLLTRYPQHLPPNIEKMNHVLHRPYLPLLKVLSRCAALVHHGGIGTCAAGLAAGVAQLVMPMGFDQPDNATRLARLGVGSWLLPKHFSANRLASSLNTLLNSTRVKESCRNYAQRVDAINANEQTCAMIEQMVQQVGPNES